MTPTNENANAPACRCPDCMLVLWQRNREATIRLVRTRSSSDAAD